MRKQLFLVLLMFISSFTFANYHDGMNSYNRGDYKSAFNEWLPLARNGNAKAQTEIAAMYGNGDYVKEDWSKAAYWYQKAADQEEPRAQVNLGLMYLGGMGVNKSNLKASYLINEAIKSGHPQVRQMKGLLTNLGFEFWKN